LEYHLNYSLEIAINVTIPKAQPLKPLTFNRALSLFVRQSVGWFVVVATINLNDQLLFEAAEVNDVVPNPVLTSEF